MCLDDALISAYVDGEIPEPWKSRIEEHFSICKKCRDVANRYFQLDELILRDNKISEEQVAASSEIVRKNISNQIKNNIHKHIPVWKRKYPVAVPLLAAAAALIIALSGVLIVSRVNRNPSPRLDNNVNIALDVKDIEQLLSALKSNDMEIFIELPEEPTFRYLSEPQLIKASDHEVYK
jgi:hypothetical protein